MSHSRHQEDPVLDVVMIVAVIALVALIGLIARAVERL
jgi:hypothetical protein